jgi:hypothetical protein
LAALCDSNGCLGLDGFSIAMHEQIRSFTLSLLTDTARLLLARQVSQCISFIFT